MPIYKRGVTWTAHAHWTDRRGKHHQKKRGGFATKAEARAFYNRIMTEVAASRRRGVNHMTVGEFLQGTWLPQRIEELKPTTAISYTQIIEVYLVPHLGEIRLEDLDIQTVEQFLNKIRAAGGRGRSRAMGAPLSGKTVNNIAGVLHRALRDAQRWDLISSNPVSVARKPSKQSPEMKFWQPQQVAHFITGSAGSRNGAIWHLAAVTGMRRGELLGLRWCDINFDLGQLTVTRTRVRTGVDVAVSTPKTTAGRRTLRVDPKVLEALEQLKTFRQTEANYFGRPWNGDDEFVASNEDGSPIHPDALTRQFKALARTLGLPVIRLHDLRHSYVVLSRRAGIDLSVTSRRIGHAHVSTTLGIYNHVYEDDDAHAVSAVAELLEEQGDA